MSDRGHGRTVRSRVVYNKKHKKLTTVFGHKPTIYPDSYYEEDEMF